MMYKDQNVLLQNLKMFKHFTCPYCYEYECNSKSAITKHINICDEHDDEDTETHRLVILSNLLKSFRKKYTKLQLYKSLMENESYDIKTIYAKMYEIYLSFCRLHGYSYNSNLPDDVIHFYLCAYWHVKWFFELEEHEAEILKTLYTPYVEAYVSTVFN